MFNCHTNFAWPYQTSHALSQSEVNDDNEKDTMNDSIFMLN